MKKIDKVWVAGHKGMVGSAITKILNEQGRTVLTADRSKLDLSRQSDVEKWVDIERPEGVIFAAARVGGIMANNTYPADFIYDNLIIQTNVINAAFKAGVQKFVFLGSSCIYPKYAQQPIKESSLLTGILEPTNEWYAIAKIAGVKLCQALNIQHKSNFISVMPCNLYGPNDNFDLITSHVLPALIRKFHDAKINNEDLVTVWGSGQPLREFLHVQDLARAVVYCFDHYNDNMPINCGAGTDISIRDLAYIIRDIVDFKGDIIFDASKPDGTPKKLMDSSKIFDLGWRPEIMLKDGIGSTYQWYLNNIVTSP